MKLSANDRKEINAYARQQRSLRVFSHCESAYRGSVIGATSPDHSDHMNLVYFGITNTGTVRDTDLSDFGPRLADLREIEDHPSGVVVVDFYVYGRERVGDEQELDTNVQAKWVDGRLVELGTAGHVLTIEYDQA